MHIFCNLRYFASFWSHEALSSHAIVGVLLSTGKKARIATGYWGPDYEICLFSDSVYSICAFKPVEKTRILQYRIKDANMSRTPNLPTSNSKLTCMKRRKGEIYIPGRQEAFSCKSEVHRIYSLKKKDEWNRCWARLEYEGRPSQYARGHTPQVAYIVSY